MHLDLRQGSGTDHGANGGPAGLNFEVARTAEEVVQAWKMVYSAYRAAELIGPNPHRIHTARQAVGSHAAVILGHIRDITVCTLTAMRDNPSGLPLDRVYEQELNKLRSEGRQLMEVGLFADRRRQLSRSAEALFELMRMAFYFGTAGQITDFIIGVHPRHVRFYRRWFGFGEYGTQKTYPAVNDRPVVLLRGDLSAEMARSQRHPALSYFLDHPVVGELWDGRFNFDSGIVSGTAIGAYLMSQDSTPAAVDSPNKLAG